MKKLTTILLAAASAALLGGAAIPAETSQIHIERTVTAEAPKSVQPQMDIPESSTEAQVFTAKDWVHEVLGDTSVQVWVSQGEAGPNCDTRTMGACYSAEKNSIHVNPSIVGIDSMEVLVEAARLG